MADRMDFTFANSTEGITHGIQVGSHHIGKSLPRRAHIRNGFWLVVILVIVMLSLNLISYWLDDHPADTILFVAIALGAIAGVAIAMVLQSATIKHIGGKIANAAGAQTQVVIDHSGVRERSGIGDFTFSWRAYDGVAEARNGLVIVFGGMLVMLPDQAFQDQMSREEVTAFIESMAERAAKTAPWD